ncbi:MAG: creatininase family protein [Candidatus Riflebacteria bacterium]|nr:creatininase family protein [Candidatus Riflebacteria bacterium]
MNLTDLTSAEICALDRDSTVVVVPLGSIEQHGPHLPVATKCFLSEAVAFAAAARLRNDQLECLITPTVPFMPCQSSCGFPSSFAIGARTYSDALYEIGSSFSRDGFKHLYFVNLSVSPDAVKAVSVAVEDLNTLKEFRAFDPMPLWNFAPNEALESYMRNLGIDPANEIHGDIKETSAIMHLDPELLSEDVLKGLKPCLVNTTWEVLKGNFSFQEMGSNTGYLGSPALADPELGRVYIAEAAFALAESVNFTLAGNDLPELPLQIRMLLKMVDLDEM